MYNESTLVVKSDYFKLVEKAPNLTQKKRNTLVEIQTQTTDVLFSFQRSVLVTENKGLSLLVLTDNINKQTNYKKYLLEGSVIIPPNVYFNTLAISKNSSIYLEPNVGDEPKLLRTPRTISSKVNKPIIQIEEIYSYTDHVKTAPYFETTKNENYFELTIVEHGELKHIVDGNNLITNRRECLLYYPGQERSKMVETEGVTTYLSIKFSAKGIDDSLKNKVHSLKNQSVNLIEQLINIVNFQSEKFLIDRFYLILQSILLTILLGDVKTNSTAKLSMRENYENEVFQSIVKYIHANLDKQLQVSDLAEHFSVSRSTIQKYFKKYTNATPKEYINSVKLQKSKSLIRDSQLSLSEIAKAVGYGSSQYFSRVFSEEFGITPSSYAKSIVK